MNIAISAIVAFMFLMPGITFRLGFVTSRFSIKSFRIFDLPKSIIPAIAFHWLLSTIINSWNFIPYRVDFKLVQVALLNPENSEITNFITQIVWYNIILISLSYLCGHAMRYGIRVSRLDVRGRAFRFSNYWYYIFSGECLDFPHVLDQSEDIILVKIDVLCNVGGESILYSGFHFDYYLSKTGELESIHLIHPKRKKLDSESWIPISSRFLIVPFKDTINLNVSYIGIKEILNDKKQDNSDS